MSVIIAGKDINQIGAWVVKAEVRILAGGVAALFLRGVWFLLAVFGWLATVILALYCMLYCILPCWVYGCCFYTKRVG